MLRNLFIFTVDVYRICISPFTPPTCRFYPSCSKYARDSIIEHGALKGVILTFKRILRCHPFNDGGFDPVPPKNIGKY